MGVGSRRAAVRPSPASPRRAWARAPSAASAAGTVGIRGEEAAAARGPRGQPGSPGARHTCGDPRAPWRAAPRDPAPPLSAAAARARSMEPHVLGAVLYWLLLPGALLAGEWGHAAGWAAGGPALPGRAAGRAGAGTPRDARPWCPRSKGARGVRGSVPCPSERGAGGSGRLRGGGASANLFRVKNKSAKLRPDFLTLRAGGGLPAWSCPGAELASVPLAAHSEPRPARAASGWGTLGVPMTGVSRRGRPGSGAPSSGRGPPRARCPAALSLRGAGWAVSTRR